MTSQDTFKRPTLSVMLVVLLISLVALPVFAASAEGDYPTLRKAALKLAQQKKYDEAIEAFKKMAQDAKLPAQKSDALEQAATIAMTDKKFDQAMTLAKQIPDEQTAVMVQMRLLLANKDAKGVLELVADKDLSQWDDVTAGEALYLRGKAHDAQASYESAAADIEEALKRMGQSRLRSEAGLSLGNIYREHLKSPDKAIAAYQAVLDEEASRDFHGWVYANTLINKAMTQAQNSDTDGALASLKQIDLSTRTSGYWAAKFRQTQAQIHAQRGEKKQAIDMLTEALTLPKVPDFLKANLQKELDSLQSGAQ